MTGRTRVVVVVIVAAVTAIVSVIALRPGRDEPRAEARPRTGGPALPEITGLTVEVRLAYPGAPPERVETDVTAPAEDAIKGVAGLRQMRSTSTAGEASLVIELEPGTAPDAAAAAIEGALARAQLPATATHTILVRLP